ncbi:hypothetical protein mvi_09330 [Methylobacterium indicum]|uniref:Uncharacterized protein n=1 Tax=Methylobacterium indicum TaxID=1775910 RepID=A0A8H9C2P6_9HYPH|nr:hypothetical protein mvi_09330 [Methylobacterium indicum]
MTSPVRKPCYFLGSSRRDLAAFPSEVRADIGYALDLAQRGEESLSAKALRGFGGRGARYTTLKKVEATTRAFHPLSRTTGASAEGDPGSSRGHAAKRLTLLHRRRQ